jgi:hypothetical protein
MEDPAIRRIDIFAWIGELVPAEIPHGRIAAICATGDGSEDALPRAWLSARINVA